MTLVYSSFSNARSKARNRSWTSGGEPMLVVGRALVDTVGKVRYQYAAVSATARKIVPMEANEFIICAYVRGESVPITSAPTQH